MRPVKSIALLAMALLAGCAHPGGKSGQASAPSDWLEWQARRRESIAGTNGWATLVGLHWLKEGDNSAGSASTNAVVLPVGRAASLVGTFRRVGRSVEFSAAPGIAPTVDGHPVERVQLVSDAEGSPTRLRIGELSIVLLQRGERMALRVRDPQAPARVNFVGLDYFPYDARWRIPARFEAVTGRAPMRFKAVAGGDQEMASPGRAVFTVAGREHRLDVVDEPGSKEFFIIFRDETAGQSTYESGRFLYAPKPGADGQWVLDFNRAYNPPCAFTPYATCPLPPEQNWLPIKVTAGELRYKGHGAGRH